MRLAIVAAAGSSPSPDPLVGERDAIIVASRLALADLGFQVVVVDPNTDLAEQLDDLLLDHEGRVDVVLFYASCLLAVVEDDECFLCLDPAEPDVGDALTDVAEVLGERAPSALMVLDLRADQPAADRSTVQHALEAVQRAVNSEQTGVELIAAVRPVGAHPERVPSRLTAAWMETMDAVDGALSARKAYALSVQRGDFGDWPSAFGHRPGRATFPLRGEPPSSRVPEASDAPPPSLDIPPPPPTQPSAPPSQSPPPAAAATAGAPFAPAPSDPIDLGPGAATPAPQARVITETLPDDPASDGAPDAVPATEAPETAASSGEAPAVPSSEESAAEPDSKTRPLAEAELPDSGPVSERREAASVAWPVRSAKPAPKAEPKVVIGRRPTPTAGTPITIAPPTAVSPTPTTRSPAVGAAAVAPADVAVQTAAAEPLLNDTSADGPAAKRLAEEARRVRNELLRKDAAALEEAPARPPTTQPFPGATGSVVADGSVDVESAGEDVSVELDDVDASAEAPPPVPDRRKRVAEMSADDHVEAGDLARSLHHIEEAVGHYKRGLAKLGTEQTPTRAAIYVRLGEINRADGNVRVAVSNFEKALHIVPDDRRALENLVELEVAGERWREAAKAEERLLAAIEGDERLEVLLRSGERWLEQDRDRRRARERFEQARREFPLERVCHDRLLHLYEANGDTERALAARLAIADLIDFPGERAEYYSDLGNRYLALEREDEAYGVYELALEADPSRLDVLEKLASSLAEGQEWGELERVYQKMIDKFSARPPEGPTRTVLAELHHRTALLLRDHLGDPESALSSLDQELELRPRSLSAQLMAAETALEVGDAQRALRHFRISAELEPRRAETYHQVFGLGQRLDIPEVSFLAATVTNLLGDLSEQERFIFREHQPTDLPSFQQPLPDEAWHHLLADRDGSVDAIMVAIAPAVLRSRVAQLEAVGKLPDLPAEGRQDPSNSTITAVRALGWAGQYLGIAPPTAYVIEGQGGSFVAPFSHYPAVILGSEVLRGRTMPELAFLAARHITLRLPEHELVAFMRSLDELQTVFLAALEIVLGQKAGTGPVADAAHALAPALAQSQTPEEREALVEAVQTFRASGGRVHLQEWVQSVEHSTLRAGYLLCGSLEVAAKMIAAEGDTGFNTAKDRIEHLCVFTVSAEMARLRDALGIGLDAEAEAAPVSALQR